LQIMQPGLRGVNGRDEFQITFVNGLQGFAQGRQRIDGFFHGGILGGGGIIPMLHLAVLLKEGDVIDRE